MAGLLSSVASYFLGSSAAANGDEAKQAQQDDDDSLTITKLVVYPIKSCKGTSVESSEFDVRGFKFDRRWMVVEAGGDHRMLTARTCGKLFLIEPTLDIANNQLHIRIPSHGTHSIPIEADASCEVVDGIQVWGSHDMRGYVVSPPSSPLQQALCKFLDMDVLLIQFDEATPRVLGGQSFLNDIFAQPHLEDALDYPIDESSTLFADGYPFLLVTEASFKTLRTWLETETKDIRIDIEEMIERHRPNIVIGQGQGKGRQSDSGEGFVEDGWEEITCGSETIFPVSRCARCSMPDVSPLTGIASIRRMPGKILEGHRKGVDRIVNGPCLGMNAIPKARNGILRVGDKVEVKKIAKRNDEGPNGPVRGEWIRTEDLWN